MHSLFKLGSAAKPAKFVKPGSGAAKLANCVNPGSLADDPIPSSLGLIARLLRKRRHAMLAAPMYII